MTSSPPLSPFPCQPFFIAPCFLLRSVKSVDRHWHGTGTIPEKLPTAESIRMVESREKKRLKAKQKRALPSPPPAG
jgi:hypothetical protein